jgi:type I restriction enzyme M protein
MHGATVYRRAFPTCRASSNRRADRTPSFEYKIGEIFSEIENRIQSGYHLREIIEYIDELRFASQTEKRELLHLCEAKVKKMGNAGATEANITPAPAHPSHQGRHCAAARRDYL